MGKINSKKKGSKNERSLCKWFQRWSGYEFSRTPSSGGLRWKKTDNISSDIVCSDPDHSRRFCFSVETKDYKDINFEHLLLNKKSCKILDFISQVNYDSLRAQKIPMLFMRYNGMSKDEYFVLISYDFWKIVRKYYTGNRMTVILGPEFRAVIILASSLINTPYKEIHKGARKLQKALYHE